MDDEFVRIAEELRTKMWRTSGARYLASNRLARRERYSAFSIAMLSVVAIGFGLLESHVSVGAGHEGFNAAAITISVFILVISLLEGSSRSSMQASKLHDNAVSISEVRTRLESMLAQAKAVSTPNWIEFEQLRLEYEKRIRECPFNHEPIDHLRFEADHRKRPEFCENNKPRMSWSRSQWVKIRHLTNAAWLSFVSWVVVIALIALVFDWWPLVSDLSTPGQGLPTSSGQ